MELKKYQKSTIDTLEEFLKELKKVGLKYAFMGITENPYKADSFAVVPFVCIKIPTGGGKTLVACNAVEKIMDSALQHKLDKGIILWFTPSEAIKTQTLRKLKDRTDWHRRILDESFDNNIRIFSNEEALNLRKEDVNDNLCIIIASLEAFRKEKSLQNKYKVYKENGALFDHFENIDDTEYLERDSEGSIINSLANVVRMHNPLVVIDEGHKTTTQLSIDFLKDLNPSFIIEYTATPRSSSNILVEVHASQLKEEQMVKIPIVLESSVQWQNSLIRGIEKRNELEKEAKKIKGEYIRPIALLQAQPKSKTEHNITVEQIKEFLNERKINSEEIAIKTSEKNELEGVDLFDKKCKIRYIITVNALAEGWDCSFAYVLISVANLGSKIAVEQIIGRIIRLPNAKKKDNEEFNRSYVFASARNFNEAANQIITGLESNGYSKSDIVNNNSKNGKYELETQKAFNDILQVPMIALENEQLAFEDLIGENFALAKQDHKFEFEVHYDNDGRAIIDIKNEDEWSKGTQLSLKLRYSDKNYTKNELVSWLDKKLRFPIIDKTDKMSFLDKIIGDLMKKHTLTELSINRYVLADKINKLINSTLEKYAKIQFDIYLKKNKISTKKFDAFPDAITLNFDVPQEFNKNYYGKVDKLNKEEMSFLQRLDLGALHNIKYWVRNREKVDPFFIQGWKKNKFYPDFIAMTKKGSYVALEWKGEDRISNEDTSYKEEIGKLWEKLSNEKNYFFLVHNRNIEEVLNRLEKL